MVPTRARLKLLRSLRRRDARRREGLYLVEGRRLVEEAIRSGAAVEEVLASHAFDDEALLTAAAAHRIRIERIAARDVERISDTKSPQGILAVVRSVPGGAPPLREAGLHLALDGVADPGNVGTLVRAADAFAARSVLAGPACADFENPKVLRAGMGSTFHVALHRTEDLAGHLSEEGIRVVAATLDGRDALSVGPWEGACCLVLGSEAHGVSEAVRRVADEELTVPCPGRAESLNVATAGAILLFLLSGRRKGDP
jgi:TrmH family RNA methyltransferase